MASPFLSLALSFLKRPGAESKFAGWSDKYAHMTSKIPHTARFQHIGAILPPSS